MMAAISWKCKVRAESSKELGNLMTIVFSNHHSEDDSDNVSAHSAGQLSVQEKKEPFEGWRAGKLTCLVSYTHLGYFHNRRMDGD